MPQNSRNTHTLTIFIFFSKKGPLIGKNSQLRSRYLDSLTACKFSSHSSEHRRRSYELCILAQIGMHGMHGMQNNHVTPLFPLKLVIHYLAKHNAAPASFSRSQRPTVHAFLQKDALELFGSGCTPSVVHERLTGKAQSAQSLRALGRP